MLEVDIQHKQGDFTLAARFSAGGGLTALIGPSGSGKTTLANIAAGLIQPQSGRVTFGETVWFDSDRNVFVPAQRRRIGYVFQDGRLFPHLTVRQNLEYAQRIRRLVNDPATEKRLIELLGIGALLDRRPQALSGGEKSRVAIGRALLSDPALLIMDEPLAALDQERKAEILPHLEYIRDETGIPVLYVSHAMEEVARLANKVVAIDGGQSVSEGDPSDVLRGRVGSTNAMTPGTFIHAVVSHQIETDDLMVADSRAGTLFLKRSHAEPGDRVRVFIPANDIMLGIGEQGALSALNRLTGRIATIEGEQGVRWVNVDCGGEVILAQVTRRSAEAMGLAPGVEVCLMFKSVSIDMGGVFRQPA